jgi:SAM-dependent methyltransferase
MDDPAGTEGAVTFHKRDFWISENSKHIPAHYRLRKSARIITSIARGRQCDLLDIGCGPATLGRLLPGSIRYHGIDIAIHEPAPNLREVDFAENPIEFGGERFDIVVMLGVFEYLGGLQSRKFTEIAGLLKDGGTFLVTYTNFGHRDARIYEPFNNVQPFDDFLRELGRDFVVDRYFPASHNWHGGQPTRKLAQAVNMRVTANIPVVSSKLAVDYFVLCSPRTR